MRNPRASQIRHNKHKTTMTQSFPVGKYRYKFFTVYHGNTETPIYLEFIIVKRTPKSAVFLIDGKEYRRKVYNNYPNSAGLYDYLDSTNIPDPYQYNWDGEIVGRLDKPFQREVNWNECEDIE